MAEDKKECENIKAVAYAFDAQGAPPPNEQVLAWFALSGWLLVLWPWWIERHRESQATT